MKLLMFILVGMLFAFSLEAQIVKPGGGSGVAGSSPIDERAAAGAVDLATNLLAQVQALEFWGTNKVTLSQHLVVPGLGIYLTYTTSDTNTTTVFIPADALSDGSIYARKDATWQVLGTASLSNGTDFATSVQGSNGDIAYDWGDHGEEGYITGFAEVDPDSLHKNGNNAMEADLDMGGYSITNAAFVGDGSGLTGMYESLGTLYSTTNVTIYPTNKMPIVCTISASSVLTLSFDSSWITNGFNEAEIILKPTGTACTIAADTNTVSFADTIDLSTGYAQLLEAFRWNGNKWRIKLADEGLDQ